MGLEMTYEDYREKLEEYDRRIAGWLLHHNQRKKQLEKEKEEIRQEGIGAVSYSHEMKSKTNEINDSVANTVIRLDDIRLAKEVQLIEDVLKILPLEKQMFLKLRQKYNNSQGGRHKYSAYAKIQMEYAEKISKITGEDIESAWKGERTLKSWWKEIINITVKIALKRNLL